MSPATADPANQKMKSAIKRPHMNRTLAGFVPQSEECMVEPIDGVENLRAVVTIVHTSVMPRRATKNQIIKNPALVARASKGGKARAAKLTAKERSLIAKHAAQARWRQS